MKQRPQKSVFMVIMTMSKIKIYINGKRLLLFYKSHGKEWVKDGFGFNLRVCGKSIEEVVSM